MAVDFMGGIAAEGFEHMGSFETAGSLAIGDPSFLGSEHHDQELATVLVVRPGTWEVFVRAVDGAPDLIAEIVAMHRDQLGAFFDAYDEATSTVAVEVRADRLALLDGALHDDVVLRTAMFEPDELPWLVDRGCVTSAGRGAGRYPVYGFGDVCVSVAFVA